VRHSGELLLAVDLSNAGCQATRTTQHHNSQLEYKHFIIFRLFTVAASFADLFNIE
jgi:hypothetical protein